MLAFACAVHDIERQNGRLGNKHGLLHTLNVGDFEQQSNALAVWPPDGTVTVCPPEGTGTASPESIAAAVCPPEGTDTGIIATLRRWRLHGHAPSLSRAEHAALWALPYRPSRDVTLYRGVYFTAGDLYHLMEYSHEFQRGIRIGHTLQPFTFDIATSWTYNPKIAERFCQHGSIGMILRLQLTAEQAAHTILVDFGMVPHQGELDGDDGFGMDLHKEEELILRADTYPCSVAQIYVVSAEDEGHMDKVATLFTDDLPEIARRDRVHRGEEEEDDDADDDSGDDEDDGDDEEAEDEEDGDDHSQQA